MMSNFISFNLKINLSALKFLLWHCLPSLGLLCTDTCACVCVCVCLSYCSAFVQHWLRIRPDMSKSNLATHTYTHAQSHLNLHAAQIHTLTHRSMLCGYSQLLSWFTAQIRRSWVQPHSDTVDLCWINNNLWRQWHLARKNSLRSLHWCIHTCTFHTILTFLTYLSNSQSHCMFMIWLSYQEVKLHIITAQDYISTFSHTWIDRCVGAEQGPTESGQ